MNWTVFGAAFLVIGTVLYLFVTIITAIDVKRYDKHGNSWAVVIGRCAMCPIYIAYDIWRMRR